MTYKPISKREVEVIHATAVACVYPGAAESSKPTRVTHSQKNLQKTMKLVFLLLHFFVHESISHFVPPVFFFLLRTAYLSFCAFLFRHILASNLFRCGRIVAECAYCLCHDYFLCPRVSARLSQNDFSEV